MLMIRVLGPVDILLPSGEIQMESRQAGAVLGGLVLNLNRAVAAEHLALIVWGDSPPATAANTLQSYVSRLRHTLGNDLIRYEDRSYELRARPEQVDTVVFEHLVVAALDAEDPAQRRSLCQEGLALWRGAPFGELSDQEPFRLESLRLEELRLTTMELRLEADLALGRHGLVIGALEGLVEEHPYREKLWLLLVEALARSARRVEALRTCERLRSILGELGLEPIDAIRALEDDILTGKPTANPV